MQEPGRASRGRGPKQVSVHKDPGRLQQMGYNRRVPNIQAPSEKETTSEASYLSKLSTGIFLD